MRKKVAAKIGTKKDWTQIIAFGKSAITAL